jgi:hypothetical protein
VFEIIDDCKPTRVRIREFGEVTVIICGHTGYSRLDQGINYRRIVIVEGNGNGPWRIRVTDRVVSKKGVKVEAHLGSDFLWKAIAKNQWMLSGKHLLHFRLGYENVRLIKVPYSHKTGVLDYGTALEWTVPVFKDAGSRFFKYVSRWEMIIY